MSDPACLEQTLWPDLTLAGQWFDSIPVNCFETAQYLCNSLQLYSMARQKGTKPKQHTQNTKQNSTETGQDRAATMYLRNEHYNQQQCDGTPRQRPDDGVRDMRRVAQNEGQGCTHHAQRDHTVSSDTRTERVVEWHNLQLSCFVGEESTYMKMVAVTLQKSFVLLFTELDI